MKHLVFIISLILFINLNVYPQNNSINFTDENGKKQGFWIEDNECAYYVDDVLHGLSISYFKKNHNLFRIGEFENGEYAGTWMFFDEKVGYLSCKIFDIKLNDGKKVLIDKYRGLTKTPIRQAYMIEYYPTGVIKKEGIILYDSSMEVDFYEYGSWKFYNEKGELIKVENKSPSTD
ncbi:MAG TPA: hypothetical protein GX007_00560 [Bacteroidales bacterium]|jgi:hypothetical protein|nr:hypothetical protein [Bacteroidales bacterium]